MKKEKYKFNEFNSTKVLAVLFLVYVIIVGLAALPKVFEDVKDVISRKMGVKACMKELSSFYEGMLSTDPHYILLQNKGTYINFNGMISDFLGQVEMNGCLKLENNHLMFYDSDTLTSDILGIPNDVIDSSLNQIYRNIDNLCKMQESKGKHFLYVVPPTQISKYEDLMPDGYTDYYNLFTDKLVEYLQESNIQYIDLREELYMDQISHADAFFMTDHHWTIQTGFWAYGKIMEKLERMGAVSELDHSFIHPDNFEFHKYEQCFLGSCGKRTGIFYAGLDDFYTIIPKFNTEISINVSSKNISQTGSYEEICLSKPITLGKDYFSENPYGLWGWGDQPITQWRNSNAPENKKFILIGDSFGNIPFSLMSLYISTCDELDMRYYEDDFNTYYNKFAPDTIILMNVDFSCIDEENLFSL